MGLATYAMDIFSTETPEGVFRFETSIACFNDVYIL